MLKLVKDFYRQVASRAEEERPFQDQPLLEAYATMRRTLSDAYTEATSSLTKYQIEEAARELGILRRGTLEIESENGLTVLFDHAIYKKTRRSSAISRVVDGRKNALQPELWQELSAAVEGAVFSILFLGAPSGRGLIPAVDPLRARQVTLIDLSLSTQETDGVILVIRTLPFREHVFTSASILSIEPPELESVAELLADRRLVTLSPTEPPRLKRGELVDLDFEATVLRFLLQIGADARVDYSDLPPRHVH